MPLIVDQPLSDISARTIGYSSLLAMPDQSYPHVRLIYPQLFAKLSTIRRVWWYKKSNCTRPVAFFRDIVHRLALRFIWPFFDRWFLLSRASRAGACRFVQFAKQSSPNHTLRWYGLVPQGFANLGEWSPCFLSGQIHGHLSGGGHVFTATAFNEDFLVDAIKAGDRSNNLLNG